MSQLDWVAVEATTGRQLAFLPDLQPTGPLMRTLGRSDSLTVQVPLASAPSNWRQATRPFSAWLVALLNDRPVYGCLVVTRKTMWSADADASVVELACMTAEGYLDRRYVGDAAYTARGQNALAASLVTLFVIAGAYGLPGIPLSVSGGTGGTPRDRTYLDTDDKTVLSALEELSEVDGGPEWTIEWVRTDGDRPMFTPVFVVGDRVGTDLRDKGLAPPTFDVPGCVLTAELVESYEAGKGANVVTATGEKTGDDRAQSTVADASDTSRPVAELRGSVTTSDDDPLSLTAHAQGALAVTSRGGVALTLTADAQDAPVLGTDWVLGDTLAVDLSTPDGGGQGRYTGFHRCIGWQWQTVTASNPVETVAPILYVPEASL